MSLARTERAALADLFEQVGPDVPTLDEGWNTGDLMAHLLIRERRLDAFLGGMIKPLAAHQDSVTKSFAAKPWQEQLRLLRSGPPGWNPMGWGKLEELANGAEFFVHHEDARRGVEGWQPRHLDAATTTALEGQLASAFVRGMAKKLGGGVVAVLPDGRRIDVRPGEPLLELHGDPGEVLLWLFGRDASRVELQGSDAALAAAAAAHRGI